MARWSITTLPDGRYRVMFVKRLGAKPIECGICSAQTPRALMTEWLAIESEPFDFLDTGDGHFVKLRHVVDE